VEAGRGADLTLLLGVDLRRKESAAARLGGDKELFQLTPLRTALAASLAFLLGLAEPAAMATQETHQQSLLFKNRNSQNLLLL
jgi:hypothetical protein